MTGEPSKGELILYRTEDGRAAIRLWAVDGTVWLTQAEIAVLLDNTPQNVTQHLRTIYADRELDEAAPCKDLLQVQQEGTDPFSGPSRLIISTPFSPSATGCGRREKRSDPGDVSMSSVSCPVGNNAPRHGWGGVASDHRVPIGPGPFINDAGRRVLQRFPEIIEIEIAPHHGDVLQRTVGHQVGKKSDWVGQGLFGRLKPNDARCHRQQVTVMGKGLHGVACRALAFFVCRIFGQTGLHSS